MYSYVTVITNDNYLPGVIALRYSLKKVNSKYNLTVIVSRNLSQNSKSILKKLDLNFIEKDDFYIPQDILNINLSAGMDYWSNTFFKLWAVTLKEYKKIILIDSDMIVLKNIDHLFDKEHMSAVVAGKGLNPEWIKLNSGLMVIEPEKISISDIMNTLDNVKSKKEIIKNGLGDQDLFNEYCIDWSNMSELHLGEEYNMFSIYIDSYLKRGILKNFNDIYIIHYIGKEKPWNYSLKGVIKILLKSFKKVSFGELKAYILFKNINKNANKQLSKILN